jgi:hypothetical protein
VIIADPSAIEPGCDPNKRSVIKQPATLASITSKALGPKKYIEAAITGTRLMTTDHMILMVESADRTCGDAVIFILEGVMM